MSRLLAYRALGLGDLLTAVPTLRALRRAFPSHRLVLATPAWLHPLVRLADCAGEVVSAHPFEPVPWEGRPPELAVNLHGSGPQSHRVLGALRPRRLVAFACADAEWFDGPAWLEEEHEVERWARLVETCLAVPVDVDDLDLAVPSERRDSLAVVHPGGSDPARRWPAERFAEVAAGLSDAGREVVVTGNADEAELAETVVRKGSLPISANLAGRLDLSELTALVASAGVVVCNDTGVGHLATAVGTPSVLLFGPTPPELWGPPEGRPQHRVFHQPGVAARDLLVPARDVVAAALDYGRTGSSRTTSVGGLSSRRPS